MSSSPPRPGDQPDPAAGSAPATPRQSALEAAHEAIVEVRDAFPRIPDDADSWDVAEAVIAALSRRGLLTDDASQVQCMRCGKPGTHRVCQDCFRAPTPGAPPPDLQGSEQVAVPQDAWADLLTVHPERQARIWLSSYNHDLNSRPQDVLALGRADLFAQAVAAEVQRQWGG